MEKFQISVHYKCGKDLTVMKKSEISPHLADVWCGECLHIYLRFILFVVKSVLARFTHFCCNSDFCRWKVKLKSEILKLNVNGQSKKFQKWHFCNSLSVMKSENWKAKVEIKKWKVKKLNVKAQRRKSFRNGQLGFQLAFCQQANSLSSVSAGKRGKPSANKHKLTLQARMNHMLLHWIGFAQYMKETGHVFAPTKKSQLIVLLVFRWNVTKVQ